MLQEPADPVFADPACASLAELHIGWVLRAALTSVGQVFLCNSWASGLLIVGSMALCSRIAAIAALPTGRAATEASSPRPLAATEASSPSLLAATEASNARLVAAAPPHRR